MLLNTTNSRMAKMMGNTRKIKSSKAYIKEVNKSTRALFKDVRDEITGGKFSAAKATMDSMKEEAKMQKRGFYSTAIRKAFNDSNLVRLTKEYKKSVSKALRTGKLYTRENDIFDDMMKKQNKFMNSGDDNDTINQAWEAKKTEATYDAAKATISSMNANASSQLSMERQGISETKMGFNRMSAAFSVGTQQQVNALTGIQNTLSNAISKRLEESANLDRTRNALLTEIRDLTQKMVINNDTYQQMGLEKNKTVMDLIMEGRFKDALGKGAENIIKEFDSKNLIQTMSYALPTFLQQMISNPFGMVKDMLLDENTKLGRLKGSMDPKTLMTDFLMGAAGSRNNYKSRAAKAILQGEGKSINSMNLESNAVSRQAVQWSGLERRALVTVIPTYLRKILSALDKKDELIYQYDNGSGGAGFTDAKSMKNDIINFKNRSVSGGTDVSAALNAFYKKEEAKLGRQSNFSHTAIFDMLIKDMIMSAYPTSLRAVLKYSFIEYKNTFPNTPLTAQTWLLISMPAKALLAGTDEESADFGKYIDKLNKSIEKHKEESNTFAAMLNRNSEYSGYDSFVNGSRTLKSSAQPTPTPTGGNPSPPGPSISESEILNEILSTNNNKNDALDALSEAEILEIAGGNQDELSRLLDRSNYTNAKDFENSGFKVNAYHFRQWLTKKYNGFSDKFKDDLVEFAKKEQFEKIIPHVKDFGLYLDQVRYEHMRDTSQITSGEKKKIKQLQELKTRHGQFNSAFDGLERSINDMSSDPGKMDAMSGFIKKMAIAGGVAGIAGAKGLIPFAGHMGMGGITAMALGGVALTALANRKKLAELLTGGMTEEEKKNGQKVTARIWSKSVSGLGVAGIAGLGATILGAGPVLAPLLAATTGIAVAMNSEKSGFKSFFFGEGHDEEKTFFQLFKTKMLGDKDANDDGLFGRFLNPIFEKTAGIFDKFSEGLEKKVLEPLGASLKRTIEKIDASAFGEKFKDMMGFSLSEFGGIMKKNVWSPLTKSIFGGIKKLFGWGRKKKDDIQDNQKAEYGVGDNIMDMYNASNAPGADGSPTDPGPLPPDPPAGDPPGPDRSADHANGDYGNPLSGYGVRKRRLNLSGGAVKNGKGGLAALDLDDVVNAIRVPAGIRDNKHLIGKGKSDPSKHYYSQMDPEYKDIKLGILGFTNIEDAGCAIMAGAMVLSRFGKIQNENKGKELTPKYVSDVLVPMAKLHTTLSGVDYLYFKTLADKYNMEYTVRKNEQQFSIKEIKNIVTGGKGAIVALTKQKTLGNHYIVITGINGTNIYYDDPARKRALVMDYDDFCEGTYISVGLTKTKGLFGLIGKMFSGLMNVLSGNSLRNKKARQWKIRRELVDRMTREEWREYRNERKLPDGLLLKLKSRKPMINHFDGTAIKDKDGKAVNDLGYAETLFTNKLKDMSSGSGAKKKTKKEKPKNAVDSILGKDKYPKLTGNTVPTHLNSGIYFANENAYRSLMLSATIHNTHVTNTMLAAIYTKLSEQEITMYNGTNGVAYNVEHLKRMMAIKQFGGISEANSAVGPIDETKLANSRFFGGRKGIIGRSIQGLKDMGAYIKGKTIDPVMLQWMMFKKGMSDFGNKITDGLVDLKDGIIDFSRGFGEMLKEAVPAVGRFLAAPFQMVGKMISGGFEGLGKAIGGFAKGIGSAIAGVAEGFGEAVSSLVNGVVDTVRNIPSLLSESFGALTGAVTGLAHGVIGIASSIGGNAYKATKTVVKDMWKAGGTVLKGLGMGAIGIRNFFTGRHDDWKEKDITYVKVIGGHLDTVGAVGAIDRDAYVNEVKNQKRTFARASTMASSVTRLGGSTTKNNKTNNEIDAQQDKSSGVQDKQTELLERIANGGAGEGSGNGDGEKKEPFSWTDLAAGLLVLSPMIKSLIESLLPKMTPGADDIPAYIDPETGEQVGYNGSTSPSFNSDDPEDRKSWKKGLGNRIKGAILRNTGTLVTKGKAMWNGAKNIVKNGIKNVKNGIKNGKNAVKGVKNFGTGVKNLWKKSFGPKPKVLKPMTENLLGWNGKSTQLLEYTGKAGSKIAGLVDDIPLNRSLTIPKADTIMDSKNVVSRTVLLLETALTKLLNSSAVKYFLEKYKKGMSTKLMKSLKGFIEKLAKNPAVSKAAAGKFGKDALKTLAKANPYINAAFFVYDCVSGWNDADVYFDVPEPKLTLNMKFTAALSKALQGLITSVPHFFILCVLSPEDITEFVYKHWIGTDDQIKALDDAKAETKKKYTEYRDDAVKNGKKVETFDKWLDNGGGKETKSWTDRLLGFLHIGNKAGETSYGGTSGYGAFGGNTPGNPTGVGVKPSIVGAGTGMITKNAAVVSGGSFYFPTPTKLISSRAYRKRKHPVTGEYRAHQGIDIATKEGTPVYAIKEGVVTKAGWENAKNVKQGYGKRIEIKHAVGRSVYAHLSQVLVSTGQQVKKGELIGYTGNTGSSSDAHLHFGVYDGADNVVNPEKLYPIGSFTYKPGTDMKSAVFGNRSAIGRGNVPNSNNGISTNMYGQNYNLNMGVGGDKMSLAQVGCGPVTTNLFLQESGVKESLEQTAKSLRFRRSANNGFDSATLSKYITFRNVSNKVMSDINKNALIVAKFGILFAKRSSAINKLEDHHALFMKSTNSIGATLFDPYLETYKFYTWEAIISSIFEAIIPSGTGNVKGPGKEWDLDVLNDSRSKEDATVKGVLTNINRNIDVAMKTKSIPVPVKSTPAVKGPGTNVDNINLEAKLDVMITLLAQIAQNTAGGNTNVQKDTSTKSPINKAIETIMQIASQPRDAEKSNDAWFKSKLGIAKGGL